MVRAQIANVTEYEIKPFHLCRVYFDQHDEASLASIALSEESYRGADHEVDELAEALNKQQLRLFERQADILSLRIEIVNTMMKFESTSKLIQEAVSRIDLKRLNRD